MDRTLPQITEQLECGVARMALAHHALSDRAPEVVTLAMSRRLADAHSSVWQLINALKALQGK